MPLYGQGNQLTLIVNTFLPSSGSNEPRRFGFHFQGGAAGRLGISTANLNHFSVDGKVYKLGSIQIQDFDPKHKGMIKALSLKMRDQTAGNQCELSFTMKFKMMADVNAVVIYVHDVYEHGFVDGWCQSE